MALIIEVVTNLTESLTCEDDLKRKLENINSQLQRVFLLVTGTRFILEPRLANKLAMEYKEVLQLKEVLETGNTGTLNQEAIDYFKFYCSDIISNYTELLDEETYNNGNLAIATELALENKEPNIKMFNLKPRMLKFEIKEAN